MAVRRKKNAPNESAPCPVNAPWSEGAPLAGPSHRPAGPEEVIDLARQYGAASILALADVMSNGSDSTRVAAAKELLDRGYGKVGQPLELSGPAGKALTVRVVRFGRTDEPDDDRDDDRADDRTGDRTGDRADEREGAGA